MTQAGFTPVRKREALAEQIVRQLVGLVQSGVLKPGDRLPAERTLAADLDVGRPTLREALRALKLIGILDIRHGGGVFVSELKPDTLLGPLDLYVSLDRHNLATILEARRVIEGAVLAFVAGRIDESRIAKLEDNLAALERLVASTPGEALDPARFTELADAFRGIIEESADNPILVRALMSLDILTSAARKRTMGSSSLERLLDNHRRIVDALAHRDPAAARQALEAHIDYLEEVCELRGDERA